MADIRIEQSQSTFLPWLSKLPNQVGMPVSKSWNQLSFEGGGGVTGGELTRYQVPPKLKVLVPPRETNGQDQTTPEHVTVASVSARLKAKSCSWNPKNIHWWNCYWNRVIKAWYRYLYFWYQVPPPLQNVALGTNPLVPCYQISLVPSLSLFC